MSLSNYQKATLQAMNIPLFDSLIKAESGSVAVAEAETAKSDSEISPRISPIDESHIFVQQILAVFDAHSAKDLDISWLTQDEQAISVKDRELMTPKVEALMHPKLKKQLWLSLQHLFNAERWS